MSKILYLTTHSQTRADHSICLTLLGQKEEIWLTPLTKAPTPTTKQRDNTQTQPKKTSITQRLRTD